MTAFLYLASQSPRRRQLLDQLGVRHELLLAAPDEDAEALEEHIAGETPAVYCERVTQLKLDAAVARMQRRGLAPAPVLCADTTVALGRRIFGKPADADDAVATLTRLSGQTHRVMTAVGSINTGVIAKEMQTGLEEHEKRMNGIHACSRRRTMSAFEVK